MTKTILITGATDGIGFETAKSLAGQGHTVLLHGRNPSKLEKARMALSDVSGAGRIETYEADLSVLKNVVALADHIKTNHNRLDVLINNAGVYHAQETRTSDGLDVRFAVNTFAPFILAQALAPLMDKSGRIVNLSSAAQASVDLDALMGRKPLEHGQAYAQSKLAITMWTQAMAQELSPGGPVVVSVNPGSLLATKMVKEGFGIAGNDIGIGADILVRAALSDEFADASGRYFDNDARRFGEPHPDALNPQKVDAVMSAITKTLATLSL